MKQNIAFVIPSLDVGGAEHQTINHLNYFVEKGNENISLFILSNKVDLIDNLKLPRSKIGQVIDGDISYIKRSLLGRQIFSIVKETAAFFRKNEITDVIAVLGMSHLVCRLAKVLNLLRYGKSLRLTCYYRALDYQEHPLDTVAKKLQNLLSSVLAYLVDDQTIFNSHSVYEDIRSNFYVRRPLVVHNSLPVLEIGPERGRQLLDNLNISIGDDRYLILIPGTLIHKKGHELFITSFARFVEESTVDQSNICVIIAGEGPNESTIKEKIEELGLRDFFHLIGSIQNDILLSLYKVANLVVIPSIHEGFGNVAIEGLQQRTLLLVSDTGGLREIITDGQNGFTFRVNDQYSLQERLCFLYSNRDRIQLSPEQIYDSFISNFTIDKQLGAIVDFCGLNLSVK